MGGPCLRHLILHDLLDAHQLLGLQRRIEALHLKCVQLRVVEYIILQPEQRRDALIWPQQKTVRSTKV